jgi:hypothetical protein
VITWLALPEEDSTLSKRQWKTPEGYTEII